MPERRERCPSGVTSGTNEVSERSKRRESGTNEVSERSRDARVNQNTSGPTGPQSDAVYYSPS